MKVTTSFALLLWLASMHDCSLLQNLSRRGPHISSCRGHTQVKQDLWDQIQTDTSCHCTYLCSSWKASNAGKCKMLFPWWATYIVHPLFLKTWKFTQVNKEEHTIYSEHIFFFFCNNILKFMWPLKGYYFITLQGPVATYSLSFSQPDPSYVVISFCYTCIGQEVEIHLQHIFKQVHLPFLWRVWRKPLHTNAPE